MRALVRPPSPAYVHCIRSAPVPIDYGRALDQHAGYVEALRQCGLEVEILSPEPELPDACFVEDTAVIAGRAVITRPGAPERRAETASIRKRLRASEIDDGVLDGGDVLVAGGVAYVGLSRRTDAKGATRLGELLELPVKLVEVGPHLHLKSAATPVGDRILQLRGAFPRGTFELEVLETEEALGANVLEVGGHVVVSAAAPRTARLLRDFRVHVVEVGEFHKGDAGITCLSLLLP